MSTHLINESHQRESRLKTHDSGILCGLLRAECVVLQKSKRYPVTSPEWAALKAAANDIRTLKEQAEAEGVHERMYSGRPDIDPEELHLEEAREIEVANGR